MDVTGIKCPCPGTPHPEGDTVTLRDKPTLYIGTMALGWVAEQAQSAVPSSGEVALLYLRGRANPPEHGILAWTFVDEHGPIPVNADTITTFTEDFSLSYPVANAAADLYTEVIYRPLVEAMNKSSPRGPTNGSTSARSRSTSKRPMP